MASAISTIHRTREHKLSALASSMAIQMAKKRNDPLYSKYAKYRALYLNTKKVLISKYRPRVIALARKALQES